MKAESLPARKNRKVVTLGIQKSLNKCNLKQLQGCWRGQSKAAGEVLKNFASVLWRPGWGHVKWSRQI